MKNNPFLIMSVLASVVLMLQGCASVNGTTHETISTLNGATVTNKVSDLHIRTFFDSKNELSKMKAGQTKTGQSVGLNGLEQESSGTNAVLVLEKLQKIVEALPK